MNGTSKPERQYFFDDPGNVRKALRVFFVICAAVLALDFVDLVLHFFDLPVLRHAERSWEGLPGFYGIFGFVACVGLVLVAKQLRKIAMRDEDYYDR